jgi:hypothetical protein
MRSDQHAAKQTATATFGHKENKSKTNSPVFSANESLTSLVGRSSLERLSEVLPVGFVWDEPVCEVLEP